MSNTTTARNDGTNGGTNGVQLTYVSWFDINGMTGTTHTATVNDVQYAVRVTPFNSRAWSYVITNNENNERLYNEISFKYAVHAENAAQQRLNDLLVVSCNNNDNNNDNNNNDNDNDNENAYHDNDGVMVLSDILQREQITPNDYTQLIVLVPHVNEHGNGTRTVSMNHVDVSILSATHDASRVRSTNNTLAWYVPIETAYRVINTLELVYVHVPHNDNVLHAHSLNAALHGHDCYTQRTISNAYTRNGERASTPYAAHDTVTFGVYDLVTSRLYATSTNALALTLYGELLGMV